MTPAKALTGSAASPEICAAARFSSDHAAAVRAQITADITKTKNLNPRRRHRTYPRVVKRGRHNSYWIKKPVDYGTRHDRPATIRLANPAKPARARST